MKPLAAQPAPGTSFQASTGSFHDTDGCWLGKQAQGLLGKPPRYQSPRSGTDHRASVPATAPSSVPMAQLGARAAEPITQQRPGTGTPVPLTASATAREPFLRAA